MSQITIPMTKAYAVSKRCSLRKMPTRLAATAVVPIFVDRLQMQHASISWFSSMNAGKPSLREGFPAGVGERYGSAGQRINRCDQLIEGAQLELLPDRCFGLGCRLGRFGFARALGLCTSRVLARYQSLRLTFFNRTIAGTSLMCSSSLAVGPASMAGSIRWTLDATGACACTTTGGRLSALRNSRTTLPRAKPISKLVDCLDMVFLLQVEGAEKTLALAEVDSRWVAEGSFYRPRPTDRATRSYAVLGWINTVGCAAAFRIRAAWGMSLTTSADHAFIIEAGAKVSRSSRRGADAAGGERGRKSAAGRNPVKGFPSRVWKGSQVSHLWLNRRSLGIDRLDPITRPLSWLGQQQ